MDPLSNDQEICPNSEMSLRKYRWIASPMNMKRPGKDAFMPRAKSIAQPDELWRAWDWSTPACGSGIALP